MLKFFKFACLAFFSCLIFSCASAPVAKTVVNHPPIANIPGVKRIAVVPFENNYKPDTIYQKAIVTYLRLAGKPYVEDEYITAQYITNALIKNIKSVNLYKVVVLYPHVEAPKKIGVTLVGDIIEYFTRDGIEVRSEIRKETENYSYYDEEGTWQSGTREVDVEYTIKEPYREVVLAIDYRIVGIDGQVLYQTQKKGSLKDVKSYVSSLRTTYSLASEIVNKLTAGITKEIAPWQSEISFTLEKDSSKDPEMKTAAEFVKQRMYDKAYELYERIYTTTGNPAAGYNQAILMSIIGDSAQSLLMLDELLRVSTDTKLNKKIIQQIGVLRRNIADEEKVNAWAAGYYKERKKGNADGRTE
ncbi:MAG: hypothetical protein FWD54_04490 [Endomicrobia bacterium]|nr:hypothetical protein [Endomicrobiia bacterium]